jgi:hypothetical protein
VTRVHNDSGVCIELRPNRRKLQLVLPAGPCVTVGMSLYDVLSGPLTILQHRTLGANFHNAVSSEHAHRDVPRL